MGLGICNGFGTFFGVAYPIKSLLNNEMGL